MDVFTENEVVSTESARQHKDATDLVAQPYLARRYDEMESIIKLSME